MPLNIRQSLPRWRWRLLGAFLLLLTACSGTTFVYNRLDIILPWYLDRYVDLDRSQSQVFDAQLEGLLEWHRREELPRYVEFLNTIDEDLKADLTVAQLQAYADRAEEAWWRIRDPALEELLALGEELSDEQIEDFIAVMAKKQKKYEGKYLDRDDDEMREDAADSLEETLEDYLGRLNDEQLERLRVAAGELRRSDHVWLSERSAWTGQLARELERQPGWQERVRVIVRDWEENLDPDVEALYDHNTAVVQSAVVDVVNSRTEKQNNRLQKKIADFREDFELLASEVTEQEKDLPKATL